MKTPLNVLIMVIAYWLAIYGVTLVPHITNNYTVNLLWLTLVVPNVLRLIVGSIPQLAVDQKFMMIASIFSFLLAFAFGRINKKSQDTVKNYGKDTKKTLQGSALFVTTFTIGALITYYSGIHKTLYTQMGWESAGDTAPMASAMNVSNY